MCQIDAFTLRFNAQFTQALDFMLQLEYRQLSAGSSEDVSQLQSVLEAAPGYFQRLQGAPASPEQASSELKAVPEGFCRQGKWFYLILVRGTPIGCLDLLNGYPQESVAYIGLLLLVESHQGYGIGRRATDFATTVAREWGCSVLRLGVLEDDSRALSFWLGQGFVKLYTKRSNQSSDRVLVLERAISVA